MEKIKILANVCVLIATYYLTYYLYIGILNPIPLLGDSWDYHIPIAKTILDGSFLTLHNNPVLPFSWYYPGSSEAINALFILLDIPTLSNIFATLILFFCLIKLALIFKLKYYYGLIFATSFCTLNVILRWQNAVSIDSWVGVFFVLAIVLLENPKKTLLYFAKLGFVSGMLIGSKYTAILFLLVLTIFYMKKILNVINIRRLLVFLAPFSFFGLFWYIRNYLLTHNPFYPIEILGFKGQHIFTEAVWNVTLGHPMQMFNSFFAEYKIWSFSLVIAVGWLIYQFLINKKHYQNSINKLFILGLINFILYFSFPTSEQPWIMVSSFRYSYPVFIPLILGVFLLAQKYHLEELIGYITIGNMLMVTSLAYYPKLVLFYVPLAIGIFYLTNRIKVKRKIKFF